MNKHEDVDFVEVSEISPFARWGVIVRGAIIGIQNADKHVSVGQRRQHKSIIGILTHPEGCTSTCTYVHLSEVVVEKIIRYFG